MNSSSFFKSKNQQSEKNSSSELADQAQQTEQSKQSQQAQQTEKLHQSYHAQYTQHTYQSPYPQGFQDHQEVRILIIDDEPSIREVLCLTLKDEGFVVQTASNGQEGLQKLRDFTPHIVFLDIWMPGSLDGIDVLTQAKKQFVDTEFIMISGHGSIETAVRSTKLGAWDFIEKPLSMDRILINVSNILHFQQEKTQKKGLLIQFQKNLALVGESPVLVAIKEKITHIGTHNKPVLILGEKGSGSRLVAQNIHFASACAGLPFVELNCANIPVDLFDYEVFGWSQGVLPGQPFEQKGKLELAQGGTLYLAEAHCISESSQYKLVRFLKTKQFQRAGSQVFLSSQTRVIFSSSEGFSILKKPYFTDAVQSSEIGDDSWLDKVEIPALRERQEDIMPLFWHFSDSILREQGVNRKTLSLESQEVLKKYSWPGNLREFRNFVERLYLLTPTESIEVHDLYFAGLPSEGGSAFYQMNFRLARSQFEKQFLVEKLKEFDGNISKTAEAIGLERSYLHRKLKAYGIGIGTGENVL
jgi:two-component system, NtrC family, nitrogen regulation response regulator NtrX